jgi:hypothetical protein
VEVEAAKAGVRRVVRKSETSALVSAVQDVLGSTHDTDSALSKPEASSAGDMGARRREGRIRELCDRLFSSDEDDAQVPLFRELRAALHEHIENVRAKLLYYPGGIEAPRPDAARPQNTSEPDPSKVIPIKKPGQ